MSADENKAALVPPEPPVTVAHEEGESIPVLHRLLGERAETAQAEIDRINAMPLRPWNHWLNETGRTELATMSNNKRRIGELQGLLDDSKEQVPGDVMTRKTSPNVFVRD